MLPGGSGMWGSQLGVKAADIEHHENPQMEEDEAAEEPHGHNGKVNVESGHDEDVNSVEQLSSVPTEFLSGDVRRPLQFVDGKNVYTYLLRPMWQAVVFILLVEALERFSYYGVSFTSTAYLQGKYGNWSANLGGSEAASWTQISTAIAYSAPFVGAITSDALLGNYWTITIFTSAVYIPGLLLIALSAYPYLFGDEYPLSLVQAGFLALYPIGAGGIKACVNVMGAQQFHPKLQKTQITNYYLLFYTSIQVGALLGGISIPIIVQYDTFAAYMIPVCALTIGLTVFLLGTPRYVRMAPAGSDILESLKASASSFRYCPPSMERTKVSNGGKYDDKFVDKVKVMGRVIIIMLLTVAFNIAYGQMASCFILQGSVMQPVSFIDASFMQNADAIAVMIAGYVVGSHLYPALERRGIHLHMCTKFAIGTTLGALALLCATIVDYQIHSVYASTGGQVNIFAQVPSFFLIGFGEIFVISSAYDAAYTLSPVGMKAFGSAINLFCIGAIPNFISTAILSACTGLAFTNASGGTSIDTLEEYTQAHVYYYFWILFGIALFGALICLLPPVRRFYTLTQEKSEALLMEN